MVDPGTATLAATAVGYLVPYLAVAGKEGAKKVGGVAADGALRLLGFPEEHTSGAEAKKVLAEVEAQPTDQRQTKLFYRSIYATYSRARSSVSG